jgi:hypothetical protein
MVSDELARAGLDRINVSLDSVDAATCTAITRRDRLADVLDGLSAARDAGLNPIKINSLLMRGVTDNQPSRCVASVTLPVDRCVRSVTRQPSNMRRSVRPRGSRYRRCSSLIGSAAGPIARLGGSSRTWNIGWSERVDVHYHVARLPGNRRRPVALR